MTVPVIVEIGVNHTGDPSYAREYLDKLIEAKVDAVTFQVHSPLNTTSDAKDSETLKSRLLPDEFYRQAFARLKAAGIKVGIATTDYQSVPHFVSIGVEFFKTLGADITCHPLFEVLAETGLPVYVSTAYAQEEEIAQALALLPNHDLITLLYTDGIAGALGGTHLRTIEYFRKRFATAVGYGKHSVGDDILIASLAFDPAVIFIYVKGDRQVAHPDDAHAVFWSDVPNLLARIRTVEQALARKPDPSLLNFIVPEKAQKQRRRLVASDSIAQGSEFTSSNVAATRPAGELCAQHYGSLLGRTARRAYAQGESIAASELD